MKREFTQGQKTTMMRAYSALMIVFGALIDANYWQARNELSSFVVKTTVVMVLIDTFNLVVLALKIKWQLRLLAVGI